jgi:hypothetical protein
MQVHQEEEQYLYLLAMISLIIENGCIVGWSAKAEQA